MKKRMTALLALLVLFGSLITLTGCTSTTVNVTIPGTYYFYDSENTENTENRAYYALTENEGYKTWTFHDPAGIEPDATGSYVYDEDNKTVTLKLTNSEEVYLTAKAMNNTLVFNMGEENEANYAQNGTTGMWDFITNLFGYVMKFCYSISFGNYALALLFYAVFFKLLLIVFSVKQQKTQIKMAKLRPKIAAIEEKYAGRTDQKSMQKKQQEIMDLQQSEGSSPLSGCLPLLLQMPIILALFAIIRSPLTYISQLSQPAVNLLATHLNLDVTGNAYYHMSIISGLSGSTDATVQSIIGNVTIPNLTVLGIDFGAMPSFENLSVTVIIPFLVFIAQFATMKISRKYMAQPTAEAQGNAVSTWIMDLMFPALTLVFAFQYPAALGVYWIYQSVLALIQSYVLAKIMPLPTYTEEELKELKKEAKRREQENRASVKSTPSASGSLHHIDDDDEDYADIEYHSKYDDEETETEAPKKTAVLNGAPVEKAPEKKNKK